MIGSNNIHVLDKPMEVDCIEWGYARPNCNALFVDGNSSSTMKVIAYALNEQGNFELRLIKQKNNKYKLFAGVDASMLNFIGSVLCFRPMFN